MKIYIGHSNQWKYEEELYQPIKQSNLVSKHNVTFPHDNKENFNTNNVITDSDLFVAEVSMPSLGLGIEIGRAESIGKKILCIYQKGYPCPSSLKYVKVDILEYEDKNDMITKLEKYIEENN